MNPVGILIGEGPGPEEVELGRPFVGPTGRQLDLELADAGLQRSKLFVVNATACRPPPGKTEGQLRRAVKCCRPALLAQLAKHGSTHRKVPIFAMGKAALEGLLGHEQSIENVRGFIRWEPFPLIVSWHPTYAFYWNPYEWGAFSTDLHRFGRLIRGELAKVPEIVTHDDDGEAKVYHALKRMCRRPWVTVDIETYPALNEDPELGKQGWSAKYPTLAQLNLLGFGSPTLAVSFKWGTASNPVKGLALSILYSQRIKKVFQNGYWYDSVVLKRFGIPVDVADDTRDARRAISATSPLDLAYMASIYDDVHQWKAGRVWDKQEYNAYDCAVTARTWAAIQAEPEWKTPRVQRLYEIHKELSKIASGMHQRGIQVDAPTRSFMGLALQQEFEEKSAALITKVNIDGFRCNPNDLRAIIYKRHEKGALKKFSLPDPIDLAMWTDPERMDTCSVDFDSLILLLIDPATPSALKEIIDLYWAAIEVQKARSTFVVSNLVTRAIGKDGRLRPGWNSCGTDTGRFSCSEPNVMNIEQSLRAMYVAKEGYVLVHADYSQLELRVMAAVAQDTVLQQFLDEGDVYSNDVRAFFGGEFATMTDEEIKNGKGKAHRKSAKIIHLGSQYAAGTPTVFSQALRQDRKMQYTACRLLHDAWKRTYARTVWYWQEEMERVMKTGYSESRILHRRRTYPRPPPITEVANYPIQATASDIANLALIELDKRLRKVSPHARVIIQLHDAFDVEAPIDQAEMVAATMKEVMEKPFEIEGKAYTFPVEIKTSACWGDL